MPNWEQFLNEGALTNYRSEKEGKVILQTYDSQSSVIKRIVDYDFEGFYEDEINETIENIKSKI